MRTSIMLILLILSSISLAPAMRHSAYECLSLLSKIESVIMGLSLIEKGEITIASTASRICGTPTGVQCE